MRCGLGLGADEVKTLGPDGAPMCSALDTDCQLKIDQHEERKNVRERIREGKIKMLIFLILNRTDGFSK